MTEPEDIPEPDRAEGAPHPRETLRLHGQEAAEAAFLDVWRAGRLHHAWLVTGPKGVGKATLAWRIARALLAEEPVPAGLFGASDGPTLQLDPDHPVARRTRALSEPRLCLVRRGWDEKAKRLRGEITVDEARRLKSFLALKATDGGRRVILVDSVDEMNRAAANALLKTLEEPPRDTVLLLVSHQPARLLPTIRSRCRELRCATLAPGPLAAALSDAGIAVPEADAGPLAELAGGAPGQALDLVTLDGLALYAGIVALFARPGSLDRARAVRLSDGMRPNDPGTALFVRLVETFLARLAATGAGRPPERPAAPGEAAVLAALAPSRAAAQAWADLHQSLGARTRRGLSVNLDPSALILDMILTIHQTASAFAAGGAGSR